MRSYARRGFVNAYCEPKSLRRYATTRTDWSGTQTLQLGHWIECDHVDASWIVLPVDPFDQFSNYKAFNSIAKNAEDLWTLISKRHGSTTCTLMNVTDLFPDDRPVNPVVKEPCFEYAMIPNPKDFWLDNKVPIVYPKDVLGHSVPLIAVSLDKLKGAKDLEWKVPLGPIFTAPSLGVILRRRNTSEPQVWSFHVTQKIVTNVPRLVDFHTYFEHNNPSYWMNGQYDNRILFKDVMPREPVELEPDLGALLNGSDAYESRAEPNPEVLPTEPIEVKPPPRRIIFKPRPEPVVPVKVSLSTSRSLRELLLEYLWKFK